MSDLHDRLERLARRGTARGADVVLTEATRRADDRGALAGVDEPAPVDDSRPVVVPITLEPVSSSRKPRRLGALVTAGGVAASLFVGILAIGSITGSGGGANSPEGAVRQLADAVSHEDALTAADVLAPEEVRSLRGTVDAASKRAQELALAESAAAPLNGLDLSVDGLDLSTESLAAGYAKVTVTGGTFSARTHKSRLSPLVQRALRDSDDSESHADLATLARSGDLPTFVMTVERDGHWYVSAAYTTLEYIREVNHLPAADLGSGQRAIATLGADTPEAAVSDALHALANADWQKLISLAPPDELPVYDYRAALVQLAADTTTNFTVDKLDTTSTVNGDTAKVVLKASGRTAPDADGNSGAWSVEGSCIQLPEYDNSSTSSSGTAITETIHPSTCASGMASIFGVVTDAPGNGSSSAITVVRKGGRWFVSAVGTALDLVDEAIRTVTRRTLYTLMNVPDLLPPDGVLTLGEPISLQLSEYGARVYTFDGHAGERLLGQATSTGGNTDFGYSTEVQVYAPDGTQLDDTYGLLDGEAVQLPTDGKYTFAFLSYSATSGTVTIWDEASAPDAAKHPQYPGSIGAQCTESTGGVQVCTPQIDRGSTTATTFTGSQSSSNSSSTSVPSVTTVPGG
jgi:hypothetical protein